MKLSAAALSVLALAVGGLVAVMLLRDSSEQDAAASAQVETYDLLTIAQAKANNVTPDVMADRIIVAAKTCEVFNSLPSRYHYLATICNRNIESGDPWYEGMRPRQLRDVAQALILATR